MSGTRFRSAITTQAVILARGLGSRMRADATGETEAGTALDAAQRAAAAQGAKGMMPFARPFLDYSLSNLADAGIEEAVLVVGPEHEAVREHFARTAVGRRVAIRFAIQQQPLGTADAVAAAAGAVREAPFLMLNSDNLYPVDAIHALAALGSDGLIAFDADALVSKGGLEAERVLKFALLDIAGDDTLREIREKPAADDPLALQPIRRVSMNLWSFTPAIFDACARVSLSPRGELELQEAVMLRIRDGARFKVIPSAEGVLDLSSRADVANVGKRLAQIDPRP